MRVAFFINLLLCFFVANSAEKRRIGFPWGLFFSFFFSILIGWLIVSTSPKLKTNPPPYKPNIYSWIFGLIYLAAAVAIFIFSFKIEISSISTEFEGERINSKIWGIFLGIGFLGAFFYTTRFKRMLNITFKKIYQWLNSDSIYQSTKGNLKKK